jgi:phosphotransferase system enzyme I (PtsP)
MQFLFAADRGNKLVASRFDSLSAPALRALRLVVSRAGAASCPVTVCGEMAGRPLEAMALIGLGFRSLSMSAASIGPVKAMILALDTEPLGALLDRALDSPCSDHALRQTLTDFAEQHGIPV